MKKVFFAIIVFLLAMNIVSCSGKVEADEESQSGQVNSVALTPVNVQVHEVVLGSMKEEIIVQGETHADTDATYSAEVSGRIESLTVDYGDRVKKGQVLARVDYAMLKAQFDQAEATHDLSKKTFERLSRLESEELISEQQIDEAKASLTQAEAQLRIAKANLEKSIVRSAVSGVVARKFVEKGEYVNPGSPIFQVVDFRKIVIQSEIPETQVARVKKGSKVTVRIAALSEEFNGKVKVVMPAAHPTSKTYQIRVEVDNPSYRILVGMAATLHVEAEHHEGVVVADHEVVVERDDRRVVFIADKGVARERTVELGPSNGRRVLLLDGLKAGERLIVVGQRDLVDGQPIQETIN